MSIVNWPREDISLKDKNDSWLKQHLDCAETVLQASNNAINRANRLWNSYNGVKNLLAYDWLQKTYGRQNRSKYIPYRLGRTKINLLVGEFLKRPLTATVTTINSEAKVDRMEQQAFMLGAMTAKGAIQDIKDKGGVDVMDGAPIPQDENDPIWQKMSDKDKHETIMQIILDEQVKSLNLRGSLSDAFLDVLVSSYCWVKVETNEEGEISFHRIDARDKIAVDIEGDPYYDRSPIKGARTRIPVHEALRRYELTKEQRDILNAARINPDDYTGIQGRSRGYMFMQGGNLMVDVIHIEWDSVEPVYTKLSPKTESQLGVDDSTTTISKEFDTLEYERNADKIAEDVKAGKYQVTTKFKTVKYEATRIGGLIDVNMRKRYFQARHWDDPSKVLNASYFGFRCGMADGVTISVQQVIENFDAMFDIIQYQKNQSIARAKGKILFYDKAGLPEGRKMRDVLYSAVNDSIVDWNSAAAGNYSQKNLDISHAIREVDWGLSDSFDKLLMAENNVINQLNQITGINENRQGDIAASSTATNANSAISASRTITEPIFFGVSGLIERVMQSIVDTSAISWAFYKTQRGEQILGTDKWNYLKVTQELGYKNYGVHYEDGGRYMEIRQDIDQAMQISLNAKELRPVDYLNVKMAETTAQANVILRTAWQEMQEAAKRSEEYNNQMQQQMQQQQQQMQMALAKENREDQQQARINEIAAKGQVQMKVDDNKAKNDMSIDNHNIETDAIFNSGE